MKIILPYPSPNLSPNARVHWAKKAKSAKLAREAGRMATLAARPSDYGGEYPIAMRIIAYPPDKRRRDADNLLASLKSSLDGIADALKVDDSRFAPVFNFAEPDGDPRVEVLI